MINVFQRAHELLAQMQPLPDPKPNTQKEVVL